MLKKEKIEKRLKRSFFVVASITAAAAVIALIAVIVISNRYSYALHNYGFAQGDIGKAMFEFADIRSSLRAAIGYDDEDAIEMVVKQHEEMKTTFADSLAEVEKTIVSKDGRQTYDEIQAEMGINKISEVVQTNAATAEEASATSQELSSQSIVLDDLIRQFVLQKATGI